MIAVDTNILVYAHRVDSSWHVRAAETVKSLAESPALWLIPWPCLHEFLAVVTHPRIYTPPTPIDVALTQVDLWLESPSLLLGCESSLYWRTLRQQLQSAKVAGAMVHDARIAAICIEHKASLIFSADRDFTRFSGIKVKNPLI
ncbi:MAG: type II toxin-antitoxin system VapC family toxin [Deltaproteobacteria bacterium]|nr:type II toxin-antitoxin system VapC family toxin [Deltaproteobacteria bacterium]